MNSVTTRYGPSPSAVHSTVFIKYRYSMKLYSEIQASSRNNVTLETNAESIKADSVTAGLTLVSSAVTDLTSLYPSSECSDWPVTPAAARARARAHCECLNRTRTPSRTRLTTDSLQASIASRQHHRRRSRGQRGQLPPLADKGGGQTVSNAPHFADLVE